MPAPRNRLAAVLAAVAALALTTGALAAPGASAAPAPSDGPAYTVTVGGKGSWTHPDDTPANTFIDKDGGFHFQQAHALYGASDPRKWNFFTGKDFDSAKSDTALDKAVNPANPKDRNNDTTWRCNNSPTGREATFPPAGTHYSQANYCDLAGVWVDPDTGDWYGLVHNEFTPQPFGDGLHYDAIDYAVSTDQGRTWTIEDHVITSPFSTERGDKAAFPEKTYHYGDGDPRLFVDTASGYFYVYYGSRIVDQRGSWKAFHGHVARAPISAKMSPGSWQKWYDGSWSQPGTGGKESNMTPVDADHPTGYTPTDREYDPKTPGTVTEQVARGETPPTSPLFVMDITYNAHLGLYIGEPQAVNQDGTEPQHYYATKDLATQKWTEIGDTGDYTTASWYRWFLDSKNRTSSRIVGKDFRAYCSYGCSGGSSSEYVNVTIDTAKPAAPVDTSRPLTIAAGNRMLSQVKGSPTTASTARGAGSALDAWEFTANGDGSYRIANTATGDLLGVATDAGHRAWGTRTTATPAGKDGPSVGQQWFVLPQTGADGKPTGTHQLVNRHSGLVLGLSRTGDRGAETVPARSWTDASGSGVGGGRTAREQSLALTPAPRSTD
ncbi:RICIN domain-containing protein [Streptomyces sp. NPDC058045]|uniref:RICIN domain-containing protein n=1 Tax=Streptomyces sp. NPDC058045 TaxID=3346311 RepID=UPI0036EC5E24